MFFMLVSSMPGSCKLVSNLVTPSNYWSIHHPRGLRMWDSAYGWAPCDARCGTVKFGVSR